MNFYAVPQTNFEVGETTSCLEHGGNRTQRSTVAHNACGATTAFASEVGLYARRGVRTVGHWC